jgi:trehalose/maltose hydrolase-like predicted phosphorylase
MIFCTGYGGILQTIIYGFAGLHITDKGIVQKNPVLPPKWKSLTISIGDKKYLVK